MTKAQQRLYQQAEKSNLKKKEVAARLKDKRKRID